MKRVNLVILFASILVSGISCNDQEEYTIPTYRPIVISKADLMTSPELIEPIAINNPGKIYTKGEYVYINEIDSGIHIIDNKTTSNPKLIGFIDLPGTNNLAIKGNLLYADSYFDLVVIDISDINNIHEVSRTEDVFENPFSDDFYFYKTATGDSIVTGYDVYKKPVSYQEWLDYNQHDFALEDAASGDIGTGGSLARFTISDNYLYSVSSHDMRIFNISNIEAKSVGDPIDLNWGIETIFPYENLLFLGSEWGMHIYDKSNPELPKHLSTYEHIVSCDPVVVKDDIAYVTLRSGTNCQNIINQLELVDVSNPAKPKAITEYEMLNPHGLGVIDNCLFITEGEYGIKSFNISDPFQIDKNMIAHHKDVHAIDVIPLAEVLMLIGNDGLVQYEYDCEGKFEKISQLSL
ncbi:LVIVD repeat-containing protein [Reichenbachiella versicolor]|uniref:LVIVD repeat-containing protein n=1 Tax=Reichenbachiella versicolor TaxID=1821036 RepID=UPI0013A58806|nr:hypothetical protein [Reichenbachiella versicolor]